MKKKKQHPADAMVLKVFAEGFKQPKKQNWEEEFFNRLANELERLFPKTNQDNPEELSKGNRTTALVLNAFANIIFKDVLDKALAQQKEELIETIKFYFSMKGNTPQERIDNLMKWLDIEEKDLPKL